MKTSQRNGLIQGRTEWRQDEPGTSCYTREKITSANNSKDQ